MKHPPGPRGRQALGFFGGGSLAGMLDFLQSTAREYGPISSFPVLHKRVFLLDDPGLIEQVLVTRQHEFQRDTGATLLKELIGDGLLTREEPLHRERRRVLQPAFHREQIAEYSVSMAAETERLAAEWTDGATVDIHREMRRLTLSIVGATLFGSDFRDSAGAIAAILKRVSAKSARLVPLVTLGERLLLRYRRWFPEGRSLFFAEERRELEEAVAPVLARRRGTDERDVLSLILHHRSPDDQPLSDRDVLNEVVTFVLAGHETTATALTWAWFLLARDPETAAAMRAELDRVLGGRTPGLSDVPQLPYTANVFREALRLYPSALLFGRRPKADTELGGYAIRRGQSVFLSPYITHRNPRYFVRPDEFDPRRWESAELPKFAYFPFGGGAKVCIGESFAKLEGVLALAILGQQWELKQADTDTNGPIDSPVLSDGRQILMQLKLRQSRPVTAEKLLF